MEIAVIVNPNSSNAQNAINFFKRKNMKIFLPKKKFGMKRAVLKCISEGYRNIVVSGGDGTINNFINVYMGLDKKKRENLSVAFVPSGSANDFHNFNRIPLSLGGIYSMIMRRRLKKIDIVEVNGRYFMTGGGFGFPSEIVFDVNRALSSKIGSSIRKMHMKDSVFLVSILNRLISGYRSVKDKNTKEEYSIVSVCNQAFIGRLFRLSPNSKNDDGLFEVCMIKKSEKPFGDFIRASDVIIGKHMQKDYVTYFSARRFEFRTEKSTYFMADGEMLAKGKTFKFTIMPRAITIFW